MSTCIPLLVVLAVTLFVLACVMCVISAERLHRGGTFFSEGLPRSQEAESFYDDRLEFYTRTLHRGGQRTVNVTDQMLTQYLHHPVLWPDNRHFKKNTKNNEYFKEVSKFASPHRLLFLFGDITHIDETFPPVFTKTHRIADMDTIQAILFPLKMERHWDPILHVHKNDIPYDKKTNRCVWRGTTTGSEHGTRKEVCSWKDAHPDIDIGLSAVTPDLSEKDPGAAKWVLPCKKTELRMSELLKFKYLVVLEGNDKASCLQWTLFSNSVVLMPPPTVVSWFMEHMLVAWVHYVPLANDLHDLMEKVKWCQNNDEECRRISTRATEYVRRFGDPLVERRLMDAVTRQYSEKIDINI